MLAFGVDQGMEVVARCDDNGFRRGIAVDLEGSDGGPRRRTEVSQRSLVRIFSIRRDRGKERYKGLF